MSTEEGTLGVLGGKYDCCQNTQEEGTLRMDKK